MLKNISLGSGSILSSGSPNNQLSVHQSLFLAGPSSTRSQVLKELRADPSPRSMLNLKNKIHLQGMLKKKAIEYLKTQVTKDYKLQPKQDIEKLQDYKTGVHITNLKFLGVTVLTW